MNISRATDTTPKTQNVPARLIAVASGKGGVGKTWFSITLAHTLAFAGENVLLFDGDLGLANVDVQLGLNPSRDLTSVLSGKVPLEEAITRYEAGGNVGFDVLAGSSGSGALGSLSGHDVIPLAKGLRMISSRYDRVIIDLAAGLDPAVTMLAGAADQMFTVVTDEPTSLTDAYAFIKVMNRHRPAVTAHVVVNMSDSISEGRRTYESLRKACSSFLKIEPPLAAIIPRDPKIKDAIRHQTALLSRHPQSPAAKALGTLAEELSPKVK